LFLCQGTDLIEAGVAEADIRKAVEIGQFVKDRKNAKKQYKGRSKNVTV
jgi:hypothetical protein